VILNFYLYESDLDWVEFNYQPSCQLSRSNVIWFKSYCPNTHTQTQRNNWPISQHDH